MRTRYLNSAASWGQIELTADQRVAARVASSVDHQVFY
jgi:hypothetical protein